MKKIILLIIIIILVSILIFAGVKTIRESKKTSQIAERLLEQAKKGIDETDEIVTKAKKYIEENRINLKEKMRSLPELNTYQVNLANFFNMAEEKTGAQIKDLETQTNELVLTFQDPAYYSEKGLSETTKFMFIGLASRLRATAREESINKISLIPTFADKKRIKITGTIGDIIEFSQDSISEAEFIDRLGFEKL